MSFDWTIVGNSPPEVTNPGDQVNDEGDTVSLQVEADDADGDELTWAATGLPSGLAIDGDGLIAGTIAADAAATYAVTVTAADPANDPVAVSFDWTVDEITGPQPSRCTTTSPRARDRPWATRAPARRST